MGRKGDVFYLEKELALMRQTSLLFPLFCIWFTLPICFVTTPPLFALEGWAATYGGVGIDRAHSIRQTMDGGYIVTGETGTFGDKEFPDIWVLKLKADGTVEWQKTYGGDRRDVALSIQQTGDGGYVAAGWTDSFGAGLGDWDSWVLKLRSDGTVEWQKTYGGGGSDDANSIQQTSDGGYIVAGGTESFGAGEADLWVLKLRPDGSIDPSCDLVRATKISSGKDSDVAVKSPRIIPFDSRANLQCPTFRSRITNVLANILCPQAASGGD
jgi:hypothetical protein